MTDACRRSPARGGILLFGVGEFFGVALPLILCRVDGVICLHFLNTVLQLQFGGAQLLVAEASPASGKRLIVLGFRRRPIFAIGAWRAALQCLRGSVSWSRARIRRQKTKKGKFSGAPLEGLRPLVVRCLRFDGRTLTRDGQPARSVDKGDRRWISWPVRRTGG